MLKRLFLPLALLLLTPLWACAQDETVWEAGKHYDLVTPAIRTADPSKIAGKVGFATENLDFRQVQDFVFAGKFDSDVTGFRSFASGIQSGGKA